MRIQDISFSELSFSALFCTYTTHFDKLQRYYEIDPFSDNAIKELASSRVFADNRKELVSDLKVFNAPFDLDKAAVANIEALSDPNTVTVATGQQMTIYGGPLFTVLKTLTTILLANRLSQITDKKVIPVFWLADEDHDYEEISGIKLPVGNEINKVKLPARPNSASIGRIDAGKELEDFKSQVTKLLPETDFSKELWQLMDEAYGSGSLKNGFARLLSRLFSKHGLIFAGSDYTPFKKKLIKPLLTAIEQADTVHEVLSRQSSLINEEFHQQAQVQESTLFLHDDKHGRLKLNFSNGKWSTDAGQQWSKQEMVAMAESHPEKLSPNVFLRPILQDTLLPNIAYVGGPAEIAYYGQMRSLYPLFGIPMPAIVPRLSATLVESSIGRILEQLPFAPNEYKARTEDLDKAYIQKLGHSEVDDLFSDWKDEISSISEEYIQYITEYDASLKGSAGKETANYLKSIDKLQQKLKRSIKQKEDTQLSRIRKIQFNLFPDGGLQEREISIVYFMNKYGISIWDHILEQLDDPHFDKHKMIYL